MLKQKKLNIFDNRNLNLKKKKKIAGLKKLGNQTLLHDN